jgi:PTH1 family peptidyl-tRNA hydrolase
LGSSEFIRVRIGIGRPDPGIESADYVLSPFRAEERERAAQAAAAAAEAVKAVIVEGPTKAMNRFNQK